MVHTAPPIYLEIIRNSRIVKMSSPSDDRFSRFSSDSKFLSVARKKKKVSVDKRFGAMFKRKSRFDASESYVDARGRPKIHSRLEKESLRKFYDVKKDTVGKDTGGACGGEEPLKNSEGAKHKLLDLEIDYARGEANLYTSSSSDEQSSEDSSDDESDGPKDGDDDQQWDKWGELDHESEYTEEASNRIAVCNMDWDRVDSQDIYIAMSSFCPTGSAGVQSVRIYMSEFGKMRTAEEEQLGPEELRGSVDPDDNPSSSDEEPVRDEDIKDMNDKTMGRVRKYQISRMKYFYAVVDFDSVSSANAVYNACDGVEYELSATPFDLRFISSDTQFDEEPISSCDSMPDPERYRPKMFSTSALTLGKVELTWDEVDPERVRAMKRAFSTAELAEESAAEAMQYIAMSSDEDIGDNEYIDAENVTEQVNENASGDTISKYKSLLAGILKKEDSSVEGGMVEEDGDQEISWGTEDAHKSGLDQRGAVMMTPWEQYLHRKKEMRNTKRQERKGRNQLALTVNSNTSMDSVESAESADLKDFSLCDEDGKGRKHKSKVKCSQRKQIISSGKNMIIGDNGSLNDLSLLVTDSVEDQKHFDLKDLLSHKRKDRRRKNTEENEKTSCNFQVDMNDQRFSALFSNPEFNVDPSNPLFKKTESMLAIIEEKQRRTRMGHQKCRKGDRPEINRNMHGTTLSSSSKSIKHLVEAVKNKSKKIK